MALLKHGNFEFKNILSGGYNITEDVPDVLSTNTMADGSVKRNYGNMPKTSIKIKFGRLDKATYLQYITHFANVEDEYTYFSPRQQTMITKKFFVTFPENSLLRIKDNEQNYDEFEVVLEQCGEVSNT